MSETTKPTNPKDLIGSDKIPLHLWPETATLLGSLALLDGASKYGRSNFRAIGVRASIYFDALRRHTQLWMEGEDNDPDSGLPHLAHALACLAIVVDAQAAGKLTDDRLVAGGYRQLLDKMSPEVKRVKERYANQTPPKHYTIDDSSKTPFVTGLKIGGGQMIGAQSGTIWNDSNSGVVSANKCRGVGPYVCYHIAEPGAVYCRNCSDSLGRPNTTAIPCGTGL